jgi:hypothetical protein
MRRKIDQGRFATKGEINDVFQQGFCKEFLGVTGMSCFLEGEPL